MGKEERFYTIELPKSTKKKYTTEPYRSSHWWLRFLEFFDFGLPYRSRKVKFLAYVVGTVFFGIVFSILYRMWDPIEDWSWLSIFIPLWMLPAFRKREVSSRGIMGYGFVAHGINWARVERYICVYLHFVHPLSIASCFLILGPWSPLSDWIEDGMASLNQTISTIAELTEFLGVFLFFFPVIPIVLTMHAVRIDDERRGYYV